MNECASSPCHGEQSSFHDLVNHYVCECVAGMTGVHYETEVNECSSSPCANNADCVDHMNRSVQICLLSHTFMYILYKLDISFATTPQVLCLTLSVYFTILSTLIGIEMQKALKNEHNSCLHWETGRQTGCQCQTERQIASRVSESLTEPQSQSKKTKAMSYYPQIL